MSDLAAFEAVATALEMFAVASATEIPAASAAQRRSRMVIWRVSP